jgi:anaerobic magnesium-protoporphyrin IX monomethyl ester cyclase
MMSRELRIFLVNVGLRRYLARRVTPPLGIMCLAAYLRSKIKCRIQLVNQRLDNLPNTAIVRLARDFEADIVGLGAMTPSAWLLPDLTDQLRRALPKAWIILGGPHVSASQAGVMKNVQADAAVAGEGEQYFEQIVRAFLEGGGLDEVPGIYRRAETGEIVKNPGEIDVIHDLDTLPMPAYDLIDLAPYWHRQSAVQIPRRKYFTLFSSRGCPYQCIYCHRIFGNRFRPHSAERMVEEVRYFQAIYGTDDIEFEDDIFNLDSRRVESFCEGIRKTGKPVMLAFPNGLRTDIMTREQINELKDAGLYFSGLALESGSPRIQKLTNKHLNIQRFLENVEALTSQGVFCFGFFMLGFPTETEEELRATIDVACRSRLHTATFATATPFPGTELYRMVSERQPEKIRRINFDGMDVNSIRINFSDVPDHAFFRYQRHATRRFFLNPDRIYRIVRDHPQSHLLPFYLPIFMQRVIKGVISRQGLKEDIHP